MAVALFYYRENVFNALLFITITTLQLLMGKHKTLIEYFAVTVIASSSLIIVFNKIILAIWPFLPFLIVPIFYRASFNKVVSTLLAIH